MGMQANQPQRQKRNSTMGPEVDCIGNERETSPPWCTMSRTTLLEMGCSGSVNKISVSSPA